MNVGKAIHTVREARGLSAKELAKKAGISVNYLSLLERGERSSPELMVVSAVAEALHFPLPLLLFFGHDPRRARRGFAARGWGKASGISFGFIKGLKGRQNARLQVG